MHRERFNRKYSPKDALQRLMWKTLKKVFSFQLRRTGKPVFAEKCNTPWIGAGYGNNGN
jgi:hypothetical protein